MSLWKSVICVLILCTGACTKIDEAAKATSRSLQSVSALPLAPTDFTYSVLTQGSRPEIILAWKTSARADKGYRVERSADGGKTYVALLDVGKNENALSDRAVEWDHEYRYRICAFNERAASAWAELQASTPERDESAGLNLGRSDSAEPELSSVPEVAEEKGTETRPATTAVPVAPPELASLPAPTIGISAAAADSMTLSIGYSTNYYVKFVLERASNNITRWEKIADILPDPITHLTRTSYVDANLSTDLPEGAWLYYRVKVIYENPETGVAYAESPFSSLSGAHIMGHYYAPKDLAAVATSPLNVRLTFLDTNAMVWLASEERLTGERDCGYTVYRSPDGQNWTAVGFVPESWPELGEQVFTDSGLQPATRYYYGVRTATISGVSSLQSAFSNIVSVTTLPAQSLHIPALTVTAISNSQLALAWTDEQAVAFNGYDIERSPDGATWTKIASVNSATRNYTNIVTEGATYSYRLKAKAIPPGSLDSYSNAMSATTLNYRLSVATSLVATAQSSSRILFTWRDNSTGESAFTVQRSTNGSVWTTSPAQGFSVAANSTSFLSTGLLPGTTYYFRVMATSSTPPLQSSAWSEIVSVRTPAN